MTVAPSQLCQGPLSKAQVYPQERGAGIQKNRTALHYLNVAWG